MRKKLEEVLNTKNIKNETLKKILGYVREEPIFFDTEKRLLSSDEILNYKEELSCDVDMIPLVDTYDNEYLVYRVEKDQFQMFDISTDEFFGEVEDIEKFLKLLDEKEFFDKIMKYCENRTQPPGLSEGAIQRVSSYCKENFDCFLPQGYMEFLHHMNGFSYDGHSIFCCYNDDIEKNFPRYAVYDLITFNTKFHEETDIGDYLLLGKSSIDYIGYMKNTKKYVIMTNGTLNHLKEFDCFKDMIVCFLDLH